MKALTIKQPWLYCITDLDKRIENRTWKPPPWIIGKEIALHASKKADTKDGFVFAASIAGGDSLRVDMPYGLIVATAVVVGWFSQFGTGSITNPRRFIENKWYMTGNVGWVLSDVRKLKEPIPHTGALGLWEISDAVMAMGWSYDER